MVQSWKLAALAVFGLGALVLSEAQPVSTPARADFFTGQSPAAIALHRVLLETLDQLADLELRYRTKSGRFTPHFNRLGLSLPVAIQNSYELRLEEVGERGFRIIGSGSDGDAVSIDETHRLRANFRVPPPSAEYLQRLALRHLRHLSQSGLVSAGLAESPEETSVFKGYFRYGVRGSEGVAFASGLRAPVAGMYLEQRLVSRDGSDRKAGKQELAPALIVRAKTGTGQVWGGEGEARIEKSQPADLDRYVSSMSDLNDIANFSANSAPESAQREESSVVDVELAPEDDDAHEVAAQSDTAPSEAGRAPASEIEIEPILSDR